MLINTGSRTDIPAFFSKWFLNRIEEGSVCTKNPYNDDIYRYSLDSKIIDCLCFCTKNPKPLLDNIEQLDKYSQFWFVTITPYGRDIEVNVPSFKKVIKSFKELSSYLGEGKVSWRYDPIFISDKYDLDFHVEMFARMASELEGYTKDCTISFIDLYQKVLRNFPEVCEVTRDEMIYLGTNTCHITIDKVNMLLINLNLAKTYTISYRPQQFINSMRSEDKPNIILYGGLLEMQKFNYRNVNCISVPSVVATTRIDT